MSHQYYGFVIGASRGIGRACSRHLAAAGWELCLVARDKRALVDLAASLPSGPHKTIAADLRTAEGRTAVEQSVLEKTPSAVVQCLGGPVSRESKNPWCDAMQINFHAVVAMDDIILPHLLEQGFGSVIYLSSSAAVHGRAEPAYASAKASLNRYIVNRGRECIQRGVALIGLLPPAVVGDDNDWAKAEISDLARYERMCKGQIIGRPRTTDELAAVVAFLCTPPARLFGGCVLPADASLD